MKSRFEKPGDQIKEENKDADTKSHGILSQFFCLFEGEKKAKMEQGRGERGGRRRMISIRFQVIIARYYPMRLF
jgi:hypothetical protein